MKKYLVFSLIIHTIVCLWLTVKVETPQDSPIEIDTINKPASPPKQTNPEGPGSKRIGNGGEGLDDLSIGDKATAENYLERIRKLIEPVWVAKVMERINFRKRNKFGRINCTTSIIINVKSTGQIIKSDVTLSCSQDKRFDEIALGVWDRNLPPPPKNLLENGILELIWNFVIK